MQWAHLSSNHHSKPPTGPYFVRNKRNKVGARGGEIDGDGEEAGGEECWAPIMISSITVDL